MQDRRLSTAAFQTPIPPTGRLSSAANPRQSLGPARVRNSNVNSTASDFASLNLNTESNVGAGRASLEPRDSLNRRSSAFGKAFGCGLVGKDPRPIRDKTYQLKLMKDLINFLAKTGYPHPISQKLLSTPSSKDFQNIFKFLYGYIDPGYDFGKKFEEEVPLLMKGLRYPYASDISKSQLYAVGSMHAWPGLLAMLGWLVELIECSDILHSQISDDSNDMDVDPNLNSAELSPHFAEKTFFDYLCKSYKFFLSGNDNFENLINDLGSSFEQRNATLYKEIDQLNALLSDKEAEYQTLTREESPLHRAQRENTVYVGDIEKFKKFISHLEIKQTKFREAIQSTTAQIQEFEKEIEDLEILRASLQAQVEAQNISPEDIDKLNSDKEQLVKTLEMLNHSKEETQKLCWERELNAQKKLDNIEKSIHEFNLSIEEVFNVSKESALLREHKWSSFELIFNPNAPRLDQMLNQDLTNIIAPLIYSLRDECRTIIHQAQDQHLALHEALDKLVETCNDKVEELRESEKKAERLIQTYVQEKETFLIENKRSEDEAEQLEQALIRLRSEISSHAIISQQKLQRSTIEFDQIINSIALEKERIGNEMYRTLDDLIDFKSKVESTLSDFDSSIRLENQY